jgi:hypothetical protein
LFFDLALLTQDETMSDNRNFTPTKSAPGFRTLCCQCLRPLKKKSRTPFLMECATPPRSSVAMTSISTMSASISWTCIVVDYEHQVSCEVEPPPTHPTRETLVGIATGRGLLARKGQRLECRWMHRISSWTCLSLSVVSSSECWITLT